MFQGTEHYDDEFFKPLEQVGATSMNGTTNFDRTNYFQNVPTTALDLALWMESDRMGHLLGVNRRRSASTSSAASCRTRNARARIARSAKVPETLFRAEFPGRPSVPHAADRLDGGSRRRDARRRQGMVPELLRCRECRAGARRRHRRGDGTSQGRAVFRPHPAGPASDPAGHVDRGANDSRRESCTTRWRSRAGCASGIRRRTTRATPNTSASSARSSAAARPRDCTSDWSIASGLRTRSAPASRRLRSQVSSAFRRT